MAKSGVGVWPVLGQAGGRYFQKRATDTKRRLHESRTVSLHGKLLSKSLRGRDVQLLSSCQMSRMDSSIKGNCCGSWDQQPRSDSHIDRTGSSATGHNFQSTACADAIAKERLESELAKAEEIKAEADGQIDEGVASMLERIKSGLSWRLPIAPPPVAAADTRVARAAIDKVEGDLAAQCELRAALESRWAEFSGAAIREYGKELAAAYGVTLVTLRNQMCQLEALDLATGGGRSARLMAEVPGFTIAGHKHAQIPVSPRREDIANAVRQWQGLARAWSRDVHAPAERVLNFEPAKEPDVNEVVYERKTALERQIVDLERKI